MTRGVNRTYASSCIDDQTSFGWLPLGRGASARTRRVVERCRYKATLATERARYRTSVPIAAPMTPNDGTNSKYVGAAASSPMSPIVAAVPVQPPPTTPLLATLYGANAISAQTKIGVRYLTGSKSCPKIGTAVNIVTTTTIAPVQIANTRAHRTVVAKRPLAPDVATSRMKT